MPMSPAISPIRLTVPGSLAYRDLAVRAIASACRLVGNDRKPTQAADSLDLTQPFDAEMVSAVSEIFNNIVLHGYGDREGEIEFGIAPGNDRITVRITDTGDAFDPAAVPSPELDAMPENGMGLHIVRSCVDEVEYEPGPPNRWRLTKFATKRGLRWESQSAKA